MIRSTWRAAGVLLIAFVASAQAADVRSPDGRIVVTVDVGERGVPQLAMSYAGVQAMPAGALGFRFRSQPAFDRGFRVAASRSGAGHHGPRLPHRSLHAAPLAGQRARAGG